MEQMVNHPEQIKERIITTLRGKAKVSIKTESSLASWSRGECELAVKVPDMPYRILYTESVDGDSMVSLSYLGKVNETWESRCSLINDHDSQFNTSGPPEKWLNQAMEELKRSKGIQK